MARVGKKLNRGDPGFLGFLGKAAHSVAKTFVPGYSTATSAIRTVSSAMSTSRPVSQARIEPIRSSRFNGGARPSAPRFAMPDFGPQLPATVGAGTGVQRPTVRDGSAVQRDDLPVTACPAGMRPNKSSYFWMSPGGSLIFQPIGTKCVKIRRRNPLNPRAFDRALSRVGSAKRFGEKLGRVTIRSKCSCKKKR